MKFKLVEKFNRNLFINESEDKSFVDKKHKQNGYKKLTNFNFYTTQNNDEGKSYNLYWTDENNNLVCKVTVDSIPASDGYKWFGNLEVAKSYRGYDLGNQIIDLIVNKYKAGALAVHKDNQIAYKLYKNHGFEIGPYNGRDKDYYYMYLKNNKIVGR